MGAKAAACVFTVAFVASAIFPASGDGDSGTIGLRLVHVYWEGQPDKRGPLIVVQVDDGLPGAKAGIQRGDIVIAIDGKPVMGRELEEINRKTLRGPIGTTVRLTMYHIVDDTQSELELKRVAYPAHVNPASDSFKYSIPGSWRLDPRYNFPLPWAPSISYHGFEDLAFSPDFDYTDSPEYHSYLFFLWLDAAPPFTAKQLESDMVTYFKGLAEQRGQNNNFKPDLSQITASYGADPAGAHTLGGAEAASFQGVVSIYDTHGQVIKLNSEVVAAVCPGSNHTAAFFAMSIQPRSESIWNRMDAVRDSFRCR